MFNVRNNLSVKRRQLFGLLLLSVICVVCVAFSSGGNDDIDIARREVLLRRIGHELLLQSGDSISRVLPVKKIADDEYRISFEKEFAFSPDSLVNITDRLLAKDPFSGDYVVNVLNCDNKSVAYGYAISENEKDNIIACRGRVQPKGCYIINIKFKPADSGLANNGYLLGSLPLLALVGFIFLKPVKQRKTVPDTEPSDSIALGTMVFEVKSRKLIAGENTTDLTGTESRLLLIFAMSPNEIIERSRLQKEIWEDEGVIVGRSLDMFISKLRKKLECDPDINIVVVRGKGYKLEIGS